MFIELLSPQMLGLDCIPTPRLDRSRSSVGKFAGNRSPAPPSCDLLGKFRVEKKWKWCRADVAFSPFLFAGLASAARFIFG